MGDPAGCGPYISLKAIEEFKDKGVEFFVIGDRAILERIPIFKKLAKRLVIFDAKTKGIEKIKPGLLSKLGGLASLNYLKVAVKLVDRERIKTLVTAPVSKEAIGMSLPTFRGHTELLAGYYKVKNFAMMMVSQNLKVVLLTRHIPLRDVAGKLRKKLVFDTLTLIYSFLKNTFKIKKPKIALASLNPHAGIHTFLEREEKIIRQAIKEFEEPVYGPYPADTLFLKDRITEYDCIICIYHDQAMIPFKLLSFKKGVNVTVGLPIVRTSPSHGVAFEVMRKKKEPFYSSMAEAIKLAYRLSL